jgi:hypothetical protein
MGGISRHMPCCHNFACNDNNFELNFKDSEEQVNTFRNWHEMNRFTFLSDAVSFCNYEVYAN